MRNLSQTTGNAISLGRPVATRSLTLAGLLVVGLAPVLPGNLTSLGCPSAHAATHDGEGETVEPATKSKLLDLPLPIGAMRSKNAEDIAKFAEALRKIAGTDKHAIGAVEVLAWESAKEVQAKLPRDLKTLGYTYTPQDPIRSDADTITLFACVASGNKKPLQGMWVMHDDVLVLAWTTLTSATETKATSEEADTAASEQSKIGTTKTAANPTTTETSAPLVVQADASTFCLNVMGRKMPTLPAMPKVAPNPGFVRGYAYDMQGHPLKGALIGVRATAVGGFYSGASAKTDAKGYYEIKPPWGVGSFYCAGYTADYGDLIAAFGLHPADGATDEFATATGVVKNWVLLPYGVGDRAKAQDDPKYLGSYYGGTIVFNYYTDAGSQSKTALPANSQIEITLTPDGPLLDGSKGRPIVVHKAAGDGFSSAFYLNNIPIGAYKIRARITGGDTLRMRETGPYASRPFGLTPKDATGEADLLLKVYDADPNSATAGHGHWKECQISLERS